jgi:hypothetical protein
MHESCYFFNKVTKLPLNVAHLNNFTQLYNGRLDNAIVITEAIKYMVTHFAYSQDWKFGYCLLLIL